MNEWTIKKTAKHIEAEAQWRYTARNNSQRGTCKPPATAVARGWPFCVSSGMKKENAPDETGATGPASYRSRYSLGIRGEKQIRSFRSYFRIKFTFVNRPFCLSERLHGALCVSSGKGEPTVNEYDSNTRIARRPFAYSCKHSLAVPFVSFVNFVVPPVP